MKNKKAQLNKSKNIILGSTIKVGGDFHLGDSIPTEKTKNVEERNSSKTNKDALKRLVSEHKIKRVLELMLEKKNLNAELENEIISHSGNWNRIQTEIRQGVVNESNKVIFLNRLIKSVLELIDKLP